MAQDLKKQVGDILLELEGEIGMSLKTGLEEAASELAEITRNNALKFWPASKTGYPKNWTYSKLKDGSFVVHNKKTYHLAHLLNNGHRIMRNKTQIAYSAPRPHIPTQAEADKLTTEIIERRLNQL